MRDVVVLIVTVAFFALCVSYVRWCDRIIGPDPSPVDEATDEPGGRGVGRAGARAMTSTILAADFDNWIGLGVTALLTIYLIVVLVRPDRF